MTSTPRRNAGLGAALIAHLRGQFFPRRQIAQLARLEDRLRQRFLAINMFAHRHRHRAGHPVAMVRYGNRDRIDGRAHFLQHFAEIAIQFGLLDISAPWPFEMPFVHVAKRDEIAAATRRIVRVAVAFAVDADAGDVDSVIGAENIVRQTERKWRPRRGRWNG